MFPIKSWNILLQKSFPLTDSENYPKSLAISHETDQLIVGTKKGKTELYKLNTWEHQGTLLMHSGSVKCIVYLNDGKHAVSGGRDGKIIKWDLINLIGKEISTKTVSPITSICYPNRGDYIYVASGQMITSHNFRDLEDVNGSFYSFHCDITKVISLIEKEICIGFIDGTIKIYDIFRKEVVIEIKEHTDRIQDIAIVKINNNLAFASVSKDKTIKLFSVNEKTLIKSLNISNKTNTPAKNILYCNDEKTITTIHEDGTIINNNYNSDNENDENSNKCLFHNYEKLTTGLYVGDRFTLVIGNKKGNIDIFISK